MLPPAGEGAHLEAAVRLERDDGVEQGLALGQVHLADDLSGPFEKETVLRRQGGGDDQVIVEPFQVGQFMEVVGRVFFEYP